MIKYLVVFAIMLPTPSFANEDAMKLLFHNPAINVTMGDVGTPSDDPGPPGDGQGPIDYTDRPWDDPANGFAPNTADGTSPLEEGQRCTGDPRCSGQPEIASGTGRGEQYYHAPDPVEEPAQ